MGRPAVLRRFVLCSACGIFSFVFAFSAASTFEMTSALLVGGARIEVVTDRGTAGLPMEDVLGWVKSAADSVRVYYGHYPISSVSIRISSFRGKGVRNEMAYGSDEGGRITIRVGNETSAAEFASDWTLTHEMIHLAFPSVEENHHWIEEGIATYVEPIARVRAGHLAPERMWADLVRDMPQGLPQKGDRGLDRTHTWGRTYWGGRFSASWPTSRYGSKQRTQKAWSTRFAPSLSTEPTFAVAWTFHRRCELATGPPEQACSKTFTKT